MGRKKAVVEDLLADILDTVNAQPAQSQPQPKSKPKRLKNAQPKATAIQHTHSFSMQAFEMWKELADKIREVAGLQKTIKKAEAKMKTLLDQADAAKKAQDEAEKKIDATEAIAKVLTAEKKEAEAKMAEAQKELQHALATTEAEIKATDEKDSPLKNTDDLPLPFPPTPSQSENDSESEEETLVRKNKEAVGAQFPSLNEQVVDLSQDEEGEVSKDATPEKATSDTPIAGKSLDQTLQEIDAELTAERAA
ncbi:uncharacterized protein CG45076-like [Camellia sinensis]|uniref:uncharacterized protein CG45076-like n=1 Tax=Camellia sinensis TaxID=4442 RepID=UPI001036CCFC|nr:uncharacterized protein CG45076-like [Camellia sinensis]